MSSDLAYREDWREEMIRGKTVMMSPRPTFNHNRVAENIDFVFRTYLKRKNVYPLEMGMTFTWTR